MGLGKRRGVFMIEPKRRARKSFQNRELGYNRGNLLKLFDYNSKTFQRE